MDSFQEKEVGKGCERVKIRITFPFRSYPTRNRKFQTKIRGKMMRKRENKKYNFVPFLPDA